MTLEGTIFEKAGLNGTSFENSVLRNVSFEGNIFGNAGLNGTSFKNSVLQNVSFRNAKVHKAIFDGATMDKLTYAALKGYGAKLTNVTVI
jgi:uncharacterized protein YjbI with pentapeptide repeats